MVHHKHRKLPWENRDPKDWQVASNLVMQGFSNFFRVVSSHYGKPRLRVKGYEEFTLPWNSHFRSANWWLEDKPFILGLGIAARPILRGF